MAIDFDDCFTVAEINRRYKEIFIANRCAENSTAYWALSDAYKKVHLRLSDIVARPVVSDDGVNHVHPRLLRNWAAQQGIPLARMGKVPTNIENAYRREHDLPLIKVESRERPEVNASNAEIRTWAANSGIEVANRGRIHRDVLVAYVADHPAEED